MATATNQFSPDHAVSPGWVLEERREVEGISHAEFAHRCGRSSKLISEITSGKASLDPGTARQFEKVLGVDAGIWLGIEFEYRPLRAQEAAASAEWVKASPSGIGHRLCRSCWRSFEWAQSTPGLPATAWPRRLAATRRIREKRGCAGYLHPAR